MPKKIERGLGRGLDALLSSNLDEEDNQSIFIETSRIAPRADQPRKNFDQESLQELADSIKDHGMLQPVLVRAKRDRYELIAGERRWRAARIAGLDSIPVIVKQLSDQEAAEISLIENLQRDDLSIIEEAQAYKHIMDKYNYTQERVAERIGKSRAHVANTIRILGLPAEVVSLVEAGKITAGHARTLVALGDSRLQIAAAREIVEGKLSVREAEQRTRSRKQAALRKQSKSFETVDLEDKLEKRLGTRAKIIRKGRGGKIEISFYNEDDLDRLLELLGLE